MNEREGDETLPRVRAPETAADVPTVPRGGGAAIGEDEELQDAHVVPEDEVRVTHTETARATEEGQSPYAPYGGLAPDRPDRSTLDNSPIGDAHDTNY